MRGRRRRGCGRAPAALWMCTDVRVPIPALALVNGAKEETTIQEWNTPVWSFSYALKYQNGM